MSSVMDEGYEKEAEEDRRREQAQMEDLTDRISELTGLIGIRFDMRIERGDHEAMKPAVLRAGIEILMAQNLALTELLIEKGVATRIEITKAIVEHMERAADAP